MIRQVAGALARSNDRQRRQPRSVVEAGTGTGKTIAYAVAAIPSRGARAKLVISTATVALQEQLFHRDLPDLKTAGARLQLRARQGAGRYVCPRASIRCCAARDERRAARWSSRSCPA
jgi:ATP-dependent DNA helicase DinG